jgi:hypothetical protein
MEYSEPDLAYVAALRIIDDPALDTGTVEEQVAKIADARKKVFEIADRAGAGGARIRSLTRMLDHREEQLTDPYPWPESPQSRGQ